MAFLLHAKKKIILTEENHDNERGICIYIFEIFRNKNTMPSKDPWFLTKIQNKQTWVSSTSNSNEGDDEWFRVKELVTDSFVGMELNVSWNETIKYVKQM